MANLVARDLSGRSMLKRWSLERQLQLPLGRAVKKDQLLVDWDEDIAERHAVVRWEDHKLHVAKCAESVGECHPIFYSGQDTDEFTIVPGEGFVIGRTIFQFEPAWVEPSSAERSRGEAFTEPRELRSLLDPDAEEFRAIGRLLQVPFQRRLQIEQIERQIVAELRGTIPQVDMAAVLKVDASKVSTLASEGSLGVCEPLVRKASDLQETAETRWEGRGSPSFPPVSGAAWAFCVPVNCEAHNYALYLSGKRLHHTRSRSVSGLPDHQRAFVQIVADIFQSARTLHDLAQCRDDMQQFFPQEIRNLLRKHGPTEAFRTATTRAAILFCDLRGSSLFAEQQAGNLPEAWNRIRAALGVMSGAITGQNGCIGDFQGDSAMAFWGWPRRDAASVRLSEDVTHACQAADKLREGFLNKARDDGPLAGFACGIGVAAGDVVAGMLGTVEQRKIGVFGPAVNLAARLESMTKQWGVSILIDGSAEKALRQDASQRAADLADRLRFLADVRPVGMNAPVAIFELMPPPAEARLPANLLKRFEVGRNAFVHKSWSDAHQQLERVAEAGDGPSRFLLATMEELRHPPADWNGTIQLMKK